MHARLLRPAINKEGELADHLLPTAREEPIDVSLLKIILLQLQRNRFTFLYLNRIKIAEERDLALS